MKTPDSPMSPLERKSADPTPEELWAKYEPEILTKIQEVCDDRYPIEESQKEETKKFYLELKQEKLEQLPQHEKIFFVKVLLAVERALKRFPNETSVLFDVDETIGSHILVQTKERPNGYTVVRPALMPLLAVLKDKGCKVGLFTSRGNLEAQLEDPTLLAQLKSFLSPELIFSTREYGRRGDSADFADNLIKDFGGPDGIVDDAKVSPDPYERPRLTGDMSKLAGLKALRGSMPKGGIVIVDDNDYPSVLNEKIGLYGVALNEKEANGIFTLG